MKLLSKVLLFSLLIPSLAYGAAGDAASVAGKAVTAISTIDGKAGSGLASICGKNYTDGDGTSFPQGSVDEQFTGVDNTSPPNANWTNVNETVKILSNTAAGGSANLNLVTYSSASSSTTVDIFVDYTTVDTVAVVGVINAEGDGYLTVADDDASSLRIERWDNASATVLTTVSSINWDSGDSLGIRIVGSTISAYRKPSGGSWAQVGTDQTDATYNITGYYGVIGVAGTTGRLDNFGITNW